MQLSSSFIVAIGVQVCFRHFLVYIAVCLGGTLFTLMTNSYANFVVQSAVDVSEGSVHRELVKAIESLSGHCVQYTFGRHVLEHLALVKSSRV